MANKTHFVIAAAVLLIFAVKTGKTWFYVQQETAKLDTKKKLIDC